ncbi:MAG TPA: hypothetical protein VMK12_16555, partial [Anaeromyxobacteraceae bacterium]|nr:hypothetical protein [Anaeromyxobacteraceae bacterium]
QEHFKGTALRRGLAPSRHPVSGRPTGATVVKPLQGHAPVRGRQQANLTIGVDTDADPVGRR